MKLHEEFLKLPKRRRYLVGVSGGRDSVALLHHLLESGFKHLVVCHLNHQLRGRASGHDAVFVRKLASRLGLDVEVGAIDVAKFATKNKQSIELAARECRFDFFAQCAKKHRCKRIILAHHADDQAETILFNLLRGSAGLKGMTFSNERVVSGNKLTVFRPLLDVRRKEITSYLSEIGETFREDESNAESFAARNRMRHEVLPLLSNVLGRDIVPNVLRAEALGQQNDLAGCDLLDELQLIDPQGRLYLPRFLELSQPLRISMMRSFLRQQRISNITRSLVVKCELAACSIDKNTSTVNLPKGFILRRRNKRLLIENPT